MACNMTTTCKSRSIAPFCLLIVFHFIETHDSFGPFILSFCRYWVLDTYNLPICRFNSGAEQYENSAVQAEASADSAACQEDAVLAGARRGVYLSAAMFFSQNRSLLRGSASSIASSSSSSSASTAETGAKA